MRINYGPAAANVYHLDDTCQLTIDWSFDGVYFKYKNEEWITLSIGEKTTNHQIGSLNTPDKICLFKEMVSFSQKKLKSYSGNSKKALAALSKIVADSL